MSADWARGLDKSLDEPVRKGDAEVAALGAHGSGQRRDRGPVSVAAGIRTIAPDGSASGC